jgi:ureidoacrylate peracid hydrolase
MSVYSVKPAKTALLIVDAQEEYFAPDGALYTPNSETIRENLVALREGASEARLLTVFIAHGHRSSGVDVGRMGDFDETEVFTDGSVGTQVIADLRVGPDDVVVRKSRYSAFVGTELESILRGNDIDTVVVAGMMTQYCSVTTARHAHDLDYRVIFVVDANAGPDLPDVGWGAVSHSDSLRVIATMLAAGVADVQTTATVLEQMKG